MNEILEKMFTKSMYEYPHTWQGEFSEGYTHNYASGYGIRNAPKKGDYVFRSIADSSPAFKVTYANETTGRIRVEETKLQVKYNEVLREHRKKSGGRGFDPEGSKLSLVEKK